MVLISLTLWSFVLLFSQASLAVLCCLEASPVIVNDEYERKYEIQEDNSAGSEYSSPYQHSSLLNVRSAQNPPQFNANAYPYQPFSQFSPYSQFNQQLQLPNQASQIAATQQGNHQYLAALQQYYAASKRQPGLSSPTAAYSQVPISQQAAQLPQTGYQHPLGALYSAAPDVSQFQFSGNGVNYAF